MSPNQSKSNPNPSKIQLKSSQIQPKPNQAEIKPKSNQNPSKRKPEAESNRNAPEIDLKSYKQASQKPASQPAESLASQTEPASQPYRGKPVSSRRALIQQMIPPPPPLALPRDSQAGPGHSRYAIARNSYDFL